MSAAHAIRIRTQSLDAGYGRKAQVGEGCRFEARSLTSLKCADVLQIVNVQENAHAREAEL